MKTRTAALLTVLFLFGLKALAVLHLRWTLNTDATIGYRVYGGILSNGLDWVVDVGNTNIFVLTNLPPGTNYFHVTAYDALGLESVPSLPAFWTNTRPASPKLHLPAMSQ